jgi:hypothetical protein
MVSLFSSCHFTLENCLHASVEQYNSHCFISGINQDRFIWKRMSSFHMFQMLIFVIPSAYQKLNPREVYCSSFEED